MNNKISMEELEKMSSSQLVEERSVSISGVKDKISMQIFDGLAYGVLNGQEYIINFPKLEFIEQSEAMQKQIREALHLKEDETISCFDVMKVYNDLWIDGVRFAYNDKKKGLQRIETWKVND